MAIPDLESRTKAYGARAKAIARRFENAMRVYGFAHTTKRHFTSAAEHWAQWVALVVPKYPSRHFTVEWGIRVLNDPLPALHVNGGQYQGSDKPFNTWFVDSDASELRCAADLEKVVVMRVLPWFKEHSSPQVLLGRSSPLSSEACTGLREALSGGSRPPFVTASLKLLGRQSAA